MNNPLNNIMKQAQQMQEQFSKAQEKISTIEVTGEAGAGMVKIVLSGDRLVKKVFIDPMLLEEEKEILEDLLSAAFNDASNRLEKEIKEQMTGFAGMSLPPGFKWPF